MVNPSSKRERLVSFGIRGCYRHVPEVDLEIEKSENETPVLPSHPLTRGPTSGGGGGRKERARERMYCACLHCMHPPGKRVIWLLQEHAKHLFTQIAANETTCTVYMYM